MDVGYFPIYRRDRQVDLGAFGGPAVARSSLGAMALASGASLDLWRLRAAAGVAWYTLDIKASTLGVTNRTSESELGYLLSLAAYPVRWHRVQIGVEARALFIVEADVTVLTFGLTLGGDALRF